MITELRKDAEQIVNKAIRAVLPDTAVQRALEGISFEGRLICVSIGKAGWQMAKATETVLGDKIEKGIVITKYGHVNGEIPGFECYEAGHPVPDDNSFRATGRALEMVSGLSENDRVLFLVSGGGSALFEKPLITGDELQDITRQLLASGASITEINTIRKRMSGVKGGRFGLTCRPAKVFSIVLSDILGDPLDMIASGPAAPDPSTLDDALSIADKYELTLSDKARELLHVETSKTLDNVTSAVTGSVRELLRAAGNACAGLGYEPVLLTDSLDSEAREAGVWLAGLARERSGSGKKIALIAGGETVVHIKGEGLGGRNQELALAAAPLIEGMDIAVFSVGSDGTDGPTDAAGGYVDGESMRELSEAGISVSEALDDNDSYHTLQAIGGLIKTGPTGTNVNDVSVALINY